MVSGNRTPRVAECQSCGGRVEAGRRGPLPRLCRECSAARHRELKWRIATARNQALKDSRADVAEALEQVGDLVGPSWPRRRFGE